MKIAIYGTSRSGKDYLIEHLVTYLEEHNHSAMHVKGSETLNKLAQNRFHVSFKELDEEKKHLLREEFISLLEQHEKSHSFIFVDGHFCFPQESGYKVVFTDADKSCYDYFFYLDSSTEQIVKNFRSSSGSRKNLTIRAEDIDAWKSFEIEHLQRTCNKLEKELVILDEDTKSSCQFILSWVTEFKSKYDYKQLTKNIVSELLHKNEAINNFSACVVDCDNTLSENDTTYDFCEFLNIDKKHLKNIFLGDRYSSYQFFKLSKLYSKHKPQNIDEAANYAKGQLKHNLNIESHIASKKYSLVVGLTVGLVEIWQKVNERKGYIEHLYGNSTKREPSYFVTPLFKRYFVEALKASGVNVTSFGDSIIDIPMLEASQEGFIVAHQKLNKAVLKYFSCNKKSNIKQIFASDHVYPIKQYMEVS